MAINAIATYMKGKATTIWVPARSISQADDVAQIYNTARELAPSILFFEDIDLIATDRAIAGNYSPILGELLGQLDGLESNDTVITIASTNYPECIEKALRDRPSRFDRRIQFELPTEEAREKMLGIFTTKIKLADDVNLRKIAEESKGFTGAYIRELVSTAAIEAIKNSDNSSELVISEKDFSEALSKFKNKGKKFGIAGT
jgi:transitional endoplasmic reticulum ATPase